MQIRISVFLCTQSEDTSGRMPGILPRDLQTSYKVPSRDRCFLLLWSLFLHLWSVLQTCWSYHQMHLFLLLLLHRHSDWLQVYQNHLPVLWYHRPVLWNRHKAWRNHPESVRLRLQAGQHHCWACCCWKPVSVFRHEVSVYRMQAVRLHLRVSLLHLQAAVFHLSMLCYCRQE